MFELLIFISYLNLTNLPDNIYYQEELSKHSTLSGDFLYSNYYFQDHLLYTEPEKNLQNWSNEAFKDNFRTLLIEEIKKSSEKASKARAGEGIFPDVDLDLNMPRGLTNIIGEGGHISVEGSQSIDLEVKRDKYTYAFQESSGGFPQIILEQRLKANINGTIGTKLHVAIDHDSDKPEQDNKLKIWYGGQTGRDPEIEDDIIQELYLGDVSSMGSEKIFGIATRGQIGSTSFNLSLGKLESYESEGSGAIDVSSYSKTINEKDYVKERYFYTGLPNPASDSLIEYRLFRSYPTNLDGELPTYTLFSFNGNYINQFPFLELGKEEDYEFRELILPGNKKLPYFYLKNSVVGYLGVYLIYADSMGNIDTLGDLTGDTLELYALKLDNPQTNDPSWNMQMRNVYDIGTISPSEVTIEINKIVTSGNNQPTNSEDRLYTNILGITNNDQGNVITNQIIWEHGDLIFPDQFPFLNPGLGADTVPIIYSMLESSFPSGDEGMNYEIIITTTSSSSTSSFTLENRRGFIIEDSEKITADGKILTKGTHYTINYQTGEVTIKQDAALPPDAQITYSFKSQPFFSFDSQYKARANISSTPIKDSKLNFDLNFLSRSDKGVFHPSAGKEPSSITVGNVDFSLNKEPEFLSKVFSQLPFVSDDSKSRIDINGACDFSLPNPSASGKSYLDDMESINLPFDLDLLERIWNTSSLPDNSLSVSTLGKLDWFTDKYYLKSRIFSEYADASFADKQTSVFVLNFQPNTSIPDPRESWGGIMKAFTQYQNFSQKNFLEIWVKAEEGELIFDMGDKMNEDIPRLGRDPSGDSLMIIPPNGILDTEDKNFDGLSQTGEDTGLDGVKMEDDNWTYRPDSLYDDGIDDYYYGSGTFTDSLKRHNKEGNGRLDSEDLNRDFALETNNSFFRYRIDLSSEEYLAKEGLNGWKVFIIPLKDSLLYEKIGNPSLESIEYSRIWFRGFDEETKITIAKVGIVGNKWKNKGIHFTSNDSLNPSGGNFKIGQRNTREDEDYIAPVEQKKDYYSNTYEQEQSLALEINSLSADNYCLVEHYLTLPIESGGKGYDFRLYKTLNFYTKYIGAATDSVRVFLRLLTDSTNYYQFSTTITQENDWDTLNVVFENFTDLKINNDTAKENYSLKGKPSLMNIAFLQLGVINPTSRTLTGEVLIDDIILKGADNRKGSNLNLNLSTNMGDLITGISYKINRKSSNYKNSLTALRTLGDKEISSQTFRITADAGNFLNKIVNCPITFSTTKSHGTPIYRVNSDVLLQSEEAESLTIKEFSRNLTVNISRKSTSDNWLLKQTIDNLQLSGSYRENENFHPLINTDTTKSSKASANYRLRIPTLSPPILGGNSSSLLPTNIELKTTYDYNISKRYNYRDSLYEKSTSPLKKEISNYGSISYKPIEWIDVDYSITTKNDLRERESFSENRSLGALGQDASLKEEINAAHRSNLLGLNNLTITYKSTFNQNHSIEYAKSLGDSLDVRSCTQQKTVRINDDFKINSLLGKIPLISKFSKNISPVKFSANYTKDGSFAYLNSKPDYKFRYGIETTLKTSLFESIRNTDGGYFNKIYSVSSGFSFSRINAKISARFTEKVPDQLLLQSTTIAKKDVTFTFPDVDIDLPDIQKYIPFLSNYVRRSSLSILIVKDSSFTEGLNKEYSSGSSSLKISTGFNLNMKNGLTLNITPQYITGKNYPANLPETNRKTKSLSVRCSYTLNPSKSGLPLPLLGRVKWDRPINLNASFTYKDNTNHRINFDESRTPIEDTRSMDFNFSTNYSFSDMVSGGLAFDYRNHVNRRLENMTSTSYGGSFNVILKF